MSAARELATRAEGRAGAAPADASARRDAGPARVRTLAGRLGHDWLPRVAWTLDRTGRTGLLGLALLLAAAAFLLSTHHRIAAEIGQLHAELASARARAEARARTPTPEAAREPGAALGTLPARAEVPGILRKIFAHSAHARLAVDSGKYEIQAVGGSPVLRHQVVFPVSGSYAHVREFIDATLGSLPMVALRDLALERKAIGDGAVEAKVRMTIFTSAAEPAPAPEPGGGPADRVVRAPDAAALFAVHSWHVVPVVPLPPPPPPPAPTAPPFPYTFLGSYAPEGASAVYFLSKGDRVVDAHVGDRLDGVYQFESAEGGQLVFTYLPLGIRQTLAAGTSP